MYENKAVYAWVQEMAELTKPDKIVWIDGSENQKQELAEEACRTGELRKANQDKYPGCYLHRTVQNDVARVEQLTFICTKTKEDAGPTNNWMSPEEAYDKLGRIFDGSMQGRTMYVIPYIMGPAGSSFSKVGIELTDSIYVVLNMAIMARVGNIAMEQLGDSTDFVKGLHSKADLNPERRFICHFPEDKTIWSVGSGYGGNVLLGKKCFALRIASWMGRNEGWFAEHMLIVGIEDPKGKITYIAAAFPSACGKTNLAMLIHPDALKEYKVWTVGDDIAWMRIGKDGRLWAVNPETGFFGVAPGTNSKTNPNAIATVQKNTIFTNVVEGEDGTVWWEGLDEEIPRNPVDWKGNPWSPDSGRPGAHPNSRFTSPAGQCPSISPEWQNPEGVPISAIIFGGRRAKAAPLVYQSFNWQHGVFVGAAMASETTAAAAGQVGVVRRDPMAMIPFCGYNMAEYFKYWIEMGKKIPDPPKIFNVNWFRTNEQGKFIWPGYGENLRVIKWIIERCEGEGEAVKTPIGFVPAKDAIDTTGLDIPGEKIESLLKVEKDVWQDEINGLEDFFEKFGESLPKEILIEKENLKKRFEQAEN